MLCSLSLFSCNTNNKYKDDNIDNYIDKLLSDTTSSVPSWNQEGYKGKWNYIDGVFLNSIINLYKKTNDKKYIDFVIKYVDYYIDKDGNFINLKDSNKPGYTSGELDTVCESKILFDLYEYTNDLKYRNAIDKTFIELMAMPTVSGSRNYAHKTTYQNQVWLDGMYMYVPFLLRYASMYNRIDLFNLVYNQYKYINDHMKDNNTDLYYHGYAPLKDIFWAKDNGCSESFWLRSIGWLLVSLTDSIEYFPDGDNKEYLKNMLSEGINAVLKYQDNESKMFYQIVDKKDVSKLISYETYLKPLKNNKYNKDSEIKNYLESSGSSMMAYVMLKGSKLGYFDLYNKGVETFKGIVNHSFKNGVLNDICITAGLGPKDKPYRDGSMDYYLAEPVGSSDAKGVGPFIMAYIEM